MTPELRVMAAATILAGAESIEGSWQGLWRNKVTGQTGRFGFNPGTLLKRHPDGEDNRDDWEEVKTGPEMAAEHALEMADAIIRAARTIPPP